MQSFVPEIRNGFRKLKEIYPDAIFPPVYFVIGRRNSGGTDSDNGLIIGAEMFADTGSRIHLTEVVCIVIHELIHYQQQAHGEDLTTEVMNEGAADFIAELITGNQIDEDTKPYGDSHEEELWKKFQADATKNQNMNAWLYNGGDAKRVGPPDLGLLHGLQDLPVSVRNFTRQSGRAENNHRHERSQGRHRAERLLTAISLACIAMRIISARNFLDAPAIVFFAMEGPSNFRKVLNDTQELDYCRSIFNLRRARRRAAHAAITK